MSGIQVRIGADTAGLEAGLRRSGKLVANTSREMSKNLKVAAKWTAGLAAAGAAISTHLVNNTMKAIDNQAKLARSLDTTIDSITALQLAASESGLEGMEASLNRMNRRLGAAENGFGEAAKAVEALNLDLTELTDMNVADRVIAISDAMRTSGVSMQQAARHAQNLGFEQQEAAAFFMQGGDALREYVDQVDRFGLALSNVDASRVEAANDAMGRVGLAARGVRQTLVVELSETIESVSNQLTEQFGESGRAMEAEISDAVTAARKTLADMVSTAADVSEALANNPAMGQFGLVGMAVFGRKGAVIGSAIGLAFEIVREQAVAMGLATARSIHPVNKEIEVLETKLDNVAFAMRMMPEGATEEYEHLREQASLLQMRIQDLSASLEEGSEAQQEFDAMMADNSGDAFVSTLRAVEAGLRDVETAADNAAEDASKIWDSFTPIEAPQQTQDLADQMIQIEGDAQERSLLQYIDFQMRRTEAAREAAEEQKEIARQEEEEKLRIRRENTQYAMELGSALAGFGAQMAGNRVQSERKAARDIIDNMQAQIDSSENMTKEEEKAVRQSAKEKVKAREEEARQAFKTQQDMQKGMIAINTASAIMMHLATDPRPFEKWAGIAAITATGLTQAAAVNSASFGGGFSMPSASSGASQAQGGGQQGGQQRNVNLNLSLTGDSFSRSQVMGLGRDMVDEINNALDDGAQLRVSS